MTGYAGTSRSAWTLFVVMVVLGTGLRLGYGIARYHGTTLSLTGEAFDGVVALLRRTFGAFEPAERRQIMTLLVTGRPVRSVTFGDGIDAERAAAAANAQEIQFLRVAHTGSRLQQQRVDHGEQRGVGAQPQSKQQSDRGHKAGRACTAMKCVTQIFDH